MNRCFFKKDLKVGDHFWSWGLEYIKTGPLEMTEVESGKKIPVTGDVTMRNGETVHSDFYVSH
jgi:hypothetical protein